MSTSTDVYCEVKYSVHAKRRMRQRGISAAVAEVLLANFDTSIHAGDTCETLGLSNDACEALVAEGFAPAVVERAKRLVAVCSGRTGMVVTILRPTRGGAGARYRQQRHTRKQSARRALCRTTRGASWA